MKNNPTGAMGLPDYLGWNWKSKAGLPIVCIPGCPAQPDNMTETLLYLVLQLGGLAPPIDLDDALRPALAVRRARCARAATAPASTEQGNFATEYGDDHRCLVKLGCKGPVVKCNVPLRGWVNGIGGCPNVGGICMACTMPGFPDKFMPFMDEDDEGEGRDDSDALHLRAGLPLRPPLRHQAATYDKEPEWRQQGPRRCTSGYQPRHYGPRRRTKERLSMATVETPHEQQVIVKEMSWDPITRIVGSLGIHTEIDFTNHEGPQVLLDLDGLPRLRHLHEGDRPARRPLHHEPHLRHLRRQPLHVLVPEPEHGLRREAAEARRLRVQPRRVRRLHVRPRDLQRLHGERGLLRADGQGDEPEPAREGRADRGAALRHPRLQDDRRHHAGAEPVHRRVLPGDAARRPLHA